MEVQNRISAYRKIKPERKVYGVPRLPHKIDAMYENVCRGNLFAYYLDPDPVRNDPVYKKLESFEDKRCIRIDDKACWEKVAWNYLQDMRARQMKMKTYNHIKRMPKWLLKLEFIVRHETDIDLRREIADKTYYDTRCDTKLWIDYPNEVVKLDKSD